VTGEQGGPGARIGVRRPASRRRARGSVARALGGLAALAALTGPVTAATPGASATKLPVPLASAPASALPPASASPPASEGPGLLPPPRSIAYTSAQV